MREIPADHLELNNGSAIPPVGFGTWQIRFNGHAKKAVRMALEAGYRLIDTARIYGNEKGVGQAVRESDIAREEIFVTTKLWNHDQGYRRTHRAVDASLKRLGLDYVDLYLIHWPVKARLESWRALEEIYKSGRAKAIGVSNFTKEHLTELLALAKVVPAVNQVEFHPYIYDQQKDLLSFCSRQKIAVEAYSPLAHASRLQDPTISEIAKIHKKSNAQVLLRWSVQHGTVPLPKSIHEERIRENLTIFDFVISAEEMNQINRLSDGSRTCWDPTSIQ